MNTKQSLLKALNNHDVRWFLERNESYDKLLSQLQTEQRSEKFIAAVMLLTSLRTINPKEFEELIAAHEIAILKEKAKALVKLLVYLRKFFPGLAYTFTGSEITEKALAGSILKQLLAEDRFSLEFEIGQYRAQLNLGIEEGKYENPYCRVDLFNNEDPKDDCILSCMTSWSELFKLQRKVYVMNFLLKAMGSEGVYPKWPYDKKMSVLGHIVNDISKTEGKKLPAWFDKKGDKIRALIENGDSVSLKLLLKKEYVRQQSTLLPLAMQILYNFGADLLRQCEVRKKLLDKSINLLEKVHTNIVNGSYTVRTIPRSDGIYSKEKKRFLLAYRSEYQVHAIVQVLSKAGWGGSLLVGSDNFPSIHEILDTHQVDYVIQSELGHAHEKDLYEEELKGRKDEKELHGKVLYCYISDQKDVLRYAEKFTEDKIMQSCLTNKKVQEEFA